MKNAVTAKLYNGLEIPVIGLGMDQVRDEKKAYLSVTSALEAGYRSIDTAAAYGNESFVGKAVKDSGIKREELYIVSKLDNNDQGYDSTFRAFEKTLKCFGLDYLDAYLIHWPGKYMYVETWKAMEQLYVKGLVKAIGVCNFTIRHIERLMQETDMLPMIDQIEYHPYFNQYEIQRFCREKGILTEAWSPLMCGGEVLKDPVVEELARKYGKTPAQVILRWHIQSGRRIFPKSVTPRRIRENIEIFDFYLEQEDLDKINKMGEKNIRIGPDPDIFFYR